MNNFFFTELLYGVVWLVAIFVLREFIISKDGLLRKIMIAYFCVEIFTYGGAAIFFLLQHNHIEIISIEAFRIMVILPKVAVKLWLLYYFKKVHSKK